MRRSRGKSTLKKRNHTKKRLKKHGFAVGRPDRFRKDIMYKIGICRPLTSGGLASGIAAIASNRYFASAMERTLKLMLKPTRFTSGEWAVGISILYLGISPVSDEEYRVLSCFETFFRTAVKYTSEESRKTGLKVWRMMIEWAQVQQKDPASALRAILEKAASGSPKDRDFVHRHLDWGGSLNMKVWGSPSIYTPEAMRGSENNHENRHDKTTPRENTANEAFYAIKQCILWPIRRAGRNAEIQQQEEDQRLTKPGPGSDSTESLKTCSGYDTDMSEEDSGPRTQTMTNDETEMEPSPKGDTPSVLSPDSLSDFGTTADSKTLKTMLGIDSSMLSAKSEFGRTIPSLSLKSILGVRSSMASAESEFGRAAASLALKGILGIIPAPPAPTTGFGRSGPSVSLKKLLGLKTFNADEGPTGAQDPIPSGEVGVGTLDCTLAPDGTSNYMETDSASTSPSDLGQAPSPQRMNSVDSVDAGSTRAVPPRRVRDEIIPSSSSPRDLGLSPQLELPKPGDYPSVTTAAPAGAAAVPSSALGSSNFPPPGGSGSTCIVHSNHHGHSSGHNQPTGPAHSKLHSLKGGRFGFMARLAKMDKGVVILGKRLGRGGSAVVHKLDVRDANHRADVDEYTDGAGLVVKMMPKKYCETGKLAMLWELGVVKRMPARCHPNIVDVVSTSTRKLCMVMPAAMCDLANMFENTDVLSSMSPAERMRMLGGAARGLHHLHSALDLVHGDIKPQNLLVTRGLVIKLADFGVSGSTGGIVLGLTKDYAAPEVMAYFGGPGIASEVTLHPLQDTYSLGVMIPQMLFIEQNSRFSGKADDLAQLDRMGDLCNSILDESKWEQPSRLRLRFQEEVTAVLLSVLHKNPYRRASLDLVIKLLECPLLWSPAASDDVVDSRGVAERIAREIGEVHLPSLPHEARAVIERTIREGLLVDPSLDAAGGLWWEAPQFKPAWWEHSTGGA